MHKDTGVDVSDEGVARFTQGRTPVLDGELQASGSVSAPADRSPSNESAAARRASDAQPHRRREHRRLATAVFATAMAVPLLLIEVAGGVDASPDPRPTAYVAEAGAIGEAGEPDAADGGDSDASANAEAESGEAARGVGVATPDDLAQGRTLGMFSLGEQLRAEAAAEEAEAVERARAAEEERLRIREEREAAAAEARRAEQERQARERAAETAAAHAAAEDAARNSSGSGGGPTAAQWAALRQCESGGNYQIVSRNGLYHGAYQFYQGTWDNIARSSGRADLVGVAPSQASPADQDAMALALYNARGDRPWPHCGAHLR